MVRDKLNRRDFVEKIKETQNRDLLVSKMNLERASPRKYAQDGVHPVETFRY